MPKNKIECSVDVAPDIAKSLIEDRADFLVVNESSIVPNMVTFEILDPGMCNHMVVDANDAMALCITRAINALVSSNNPHYAPEDARDHAERSR